MYKIFKNLKSKAAFTLIEVIVVLIIVGVLAAISLPAYYNWIARCRAAEAILNIKQIHNAIDVCIVKSTLNSCWGSAFVPTLSCPTAWQAIGVTYPGNSVSWAPGTWKYGNSANISAPPGGYTVEACYNGLSVSPPYPSNNDCVEYVNDPVNGVSMSGIGNFAGIV